VKIKILPSALADLDRGREFYSEQEEVLGDYFLDSLFSDIDSLVLYAGVHKKIFEFHRLLSRRFPFAIYYRIDSGICVIYRVLDCRQKPQRIEKALK
jgi:ParE toxin of type II toxin-antitoxin system, parDE